MTTSKHEIKIRSTRFLGPVPHQPHGNWRIIGQDGGQSIKTENGVIFVFSDTLVSAANGSDSESHSAPGGSQNFFLPNCAGISSQQNLTNALAQLRYFTDASGFPRQILQPSSQESAILLRFWPEHGIEIDGKVWFYYLGIQTTDARSIWGFRNLGTGLAVLDPDSGECKRIYSDDDWRFWRSDQDDCHFGVQVLREEGIVYVFASVRQGVAATARLARVPEKHISDPEAYEYLVSTKPRWSKNYEKACSLGECSPEFSVSFNAFLSRYLMVGIDAYTKVLTFRTAKCLWGPYSPPQRVIAVPHKTSSELVYLGFEHPEFRQDDEKKIFISYCQPNFRANSLITVSLA